MPAPYVTVAGYFTWGTVLVLFRQWLAFGLYA